MIEFACLNYLGDSLKRHISDEISSLKIAMLNWTQNQNHAQSLQDMNENLEEVKNVHPNAVIPVSSWPGRPAATEKQLTSHPEMHEVCLRYLTHI